MRVRLFIATVLMMLVPSLAWAHAYTPADGGWQNVISVASDTCDNEPDFHANGGVFFRYNWFDHDGHTHVDHIGAYYNDNATGCGRTITRIDNIHIRIFGGKCGTSFPNCASDLGNKLFDGYIGALDGNDNDPASANYRDIGDRYEPANLYVVIDYRVHWSDTNPNLSGAFDGQEEEALLNSAR